MGTGIHWVHKFMVLDGVTRVVPRLPLFNGATEYRQLSSSEPPNSAVVARVTYQSSESALGVARELSSFSLMLS